MNKLKVARVIAGKSQDQISFETGIFQSRLSKIENGLAAAKEEEKLKIAASLGGEVEEIFGKD